MRPAERLYWTTVQQPSECPQGPTAGTGPYGDCDVRFWVIARDIRFAPKDIRLRERYVR